MIPTTEQLADLLTRLEQWLAEDYSDDPEAAMFQRLCKTEGNDNIYRQLYMAGEWLGDQLRESGATKEEIRDCCFAHGQRSFGRDTWKAAEDQLAKFIAGNPDKPGLKLADEINWELFGK